MDATTPLENASLFDLVLRHHRELDTLLLDEEAQPRLLSRLLGLSLLGLAVHGLLLGAAQLLLAPASPGSGGALLWTPLATTLSFLGTTCLCLPSFWFYTQLSGLDATLRFVVCQALRTQAATSTLLLGLVPLTTALLLAAVNGSVQAETALAAGWLLPFACGLYGLRALHRSFKGVVDRLPIAHERRGDFLLRAALAWAAVFTLVCAALLSVLARTLPQLLG